MSVEYSRDDQTRPVHSEALVQIQLSWVMLGVTSGMKTQQRLKQLRVVNDTTERGVKLYAWVCVQGRVKGQVSHDYRSMLLLRLYLRRETNKLLQITDQLA